MSFVKSKGFKYLKNLIIGVGAAIVLIGALFKIESWPYASEMLIAGLSMEAFLFLMLGLLGPDNDYYWEKLYPGLDKYDGNVTALTPTTGGVASNLPALNGEVVEGRLGGMLTELQGMNKNLGALKSLQEVDFSGTKDQLKAMNNFYAQMTEAMANLSDSLEETKKYREQIIALNKNMSGLNSVYGNVLTAHASAKVGA